MSEILTDKKFATLTGGNVGNKKAYAHDQVKERINYIKNSILL
jgi:hypothetical protein